MLRHLHLDASKHIHGLQLALSGFIVIDLDVIQAILKSFQACIVANLMFLNDPSWALRLRLNQNQA